MNYDNMTHQAALTEWNGGGLDDIPTENLKEFYNQLSKEFMKRGYSSSGDGFLKNPFTGDYICPPSFRSVYPDDEGVK